MHVPRLRPAKKSPTASTAMQNKPGTATTHPLGHRVLSTVRTPFGNPASPKSRRPNFGGSNKISPKDVRGAEEPTRATNFSPRRRPRAEIGRAHDRRQDGRRRAAGRSPVRVSMVLAISGHGYLVVSVHCTDLAR
jgi:hypothetical protein